MKYLHKEVKAGRNCIVMVTFNEVAKIMLLKESEYKKYKNGNTYNYRGGMAGNSPVKFVLPEGATWHVIVEKGSYFNPKNITATVQILPPGTEVNAASFEGSSNEIIERLEKILNEDEAGWGE